MSARSRTDARTWMDRGTELFLGAVDRLTDEELAAPTALDGWTRRHVVAHVHGNAEALRRLLDWAATGVENRMYAGPRQRAEEIEALAALPAGELRTLVHRSARALAEDMDALPEDAWRSPVVTAQGRTVPAEEIPWMRAREVNVHAVDLGDGVTFADLPEGFNAALAAEAASRHATRGDAAALAAWLTGRSPKAPTLGPWL
ncbi:maleylpyruvate isomerase N-terminal domain-containing protein [Actinomadura miaoliensis]